MSQLQTQSQARCQTQSKVGLVKVLAFVTGCFKIPLVNTCSEKQRKCRRTNADSFGRFLSFRICGGLSQPVWKPLTASELTFEVRIHGYNMINMPKLHLWTKHEELKKGRHLGKSANTCRSTCRKTRLLRDRTLFPQGRDYVFQDRLLITALKIKIWWHKTKIVGS